MAKQSTSTKLLLLLVSVLPSSYALCEDRACFPPSPDLVHQDSVRSVSASSTCGDLPTSTLYHITDEVEICDSSDLELSRPVENLHDFNVYPVYTRPVLGTWWQSENAVQNVVLTLILGDTFLFQATQIVFRSHRPSSLIIEKTDDSGGTLWVPLRYYARSCSQAFPGVAHLSVDSLDGGGNNVLIGCVERYYYGDSITFDNVKTLQEVLYNPVSELGSRYYRERVLTYFSFTGLRVTLVEPGSRETGLDHFAVADWSVTGHCLCYGHAQWCLGENEAECDCEHNTMGKHCEQCLPLFNDRPWAAAYLQNANECKNCGCNGRAVSCTYDEAKGYGVCNNCTENSMGDKCDHCIQNYYINSGVAPLDSYCIACNCSSLGSVSESVCNSTNGQCVCKTNVQGRQCDECKDSYYNLRQDNVNGCDTCNCDPRGTDGSPNFCDKLTGQCICKTNVLGSRCDQCTPGYFNLSLTNSEGCSPCDCDNGGALNASCNSDTGRCDCKANIGGHNCQTVDEGFYVPLLDGIRIEAESLQELPDDVIIVRSEESSLPGNDLLSVTQSLSIRYPTLSVPRTQRYDVVIRYRANFVWRRNQLSLEGPSDGETYSCQETDDIVQPETLVFNLGRREALSALSVGVVCLAANVPYEPVFTSSEDANNQLFLDAIVFLPVLEDIPLYPQSEDESFLIDECWEAAKYSYHEFRDSGNCSSVEYSVMAELYNGAIGCDCNVDGSLNSSECNPLGGQCYCLPGVTGRGCQYCSAYHYNFTAGTGCQACGCHPSGSLIESCNHTTGECDCRRNVIGSKCSECAAEHYGLMSGSGCSPCNCRRRSSLDNNCNDTGQCNCKPGIGGTQCRAGCLDGYFNFRLVGCEPCLCDPTGSQSINCTEEEGECDCLGSAAGLKCDSCAPNSYGFGPYSERGCIECLCSGHSVNCTAATDWFLYDIASQWSLFSFQDVPEWTGETGSGDTVLIRTRPILQVSNPRFILELEDPGTDEDLFFVSPEVYGGDRRTAYGQSFYFTLSKSMESTDKMMYEEGDILLYGLHSDQPLVASLPEDPGLDAAEYQVKLHEDYWMIGNMSGDIPDMVDMIQVLSALDKIKIRAKYSQADSGSVFLHEARLNLASDDRSLSSDDPADFVEFCECPEEYTGQFCELCSEGYRWSNASLGSFSECIPCDCHNHSPMSCDIRTGICSNCTHNTVGDYCDVCKDGYYGDATVGTPDDCQPCMCPGPAGANSFADTCDDQGVCLGCTEGHGGPNCQLCLPGYFGVPTDPENNEGRCEPCQCNLSPPVCDSTTGYCTNCTGNTAGASCEECRFGFFGDIDNCTNCNCSMTGSYGNCTGDGICDCLPNVNGTKCTSCIPNTWEFESGLGCTPCDCHPMGTINGQKFCDLETGQCECKDGVTGLRCDQCMDGSWNVNQECILCDCDVDGTDEDSCTDGVCSCDQITGQCTCNLPTIAGRRCDRCGRVIDDMSEVEEIFVGHFPDCQPCPECFHVWRGILSDQIESLEEIGIFLEESLSSYENISLLAFDEQLRAINDTLTSAQIAMADARVQTSTLYAIQAQSQEVSGRISSLGAILESVLSYQASLNEELFQLGDFHGNVSIAEAAVVITSDQIIEGARLRQNTLDNIYNIANQSWLQIQHFYNTSINARVRLEALVDEIGGALEDDLERSIQQRRDAMNARNDEQIMQETMQNDARIEEIREIHQSYKLEEAMEVVNMAGDIAQRALDNSMDSVSSAQDGAEEARAVFEAAGIMSYNVTRGQQEVTATWSKSQSYRDVALSLLSNATQAYTETLDILNDLNNSANVLTNTTKLLEAVQNYTVRPFSDMASLVARINESQLQEEEVQALLEDSQRQLSRAEGIFNVTKDAHHEALAVSGHLDTIEYNLGEGQRMAAGAEIGLGYLVGNVSQIENITREVQSAAEDKVTESTTLLDDISALIQLGQSTKQCYVNNVLLVQNTTKDVQDSQTRLENSQEVLSFALTQKAQLDEDLSSKSDAVLEDEETLNQFSDNINSLEQDLINIQQQQNLDDMIREYQAQRVKMEGLVEKLDQMEIDLDQILTNLDRTDGSSLQCND